MRTPDGTPIKSGIPCAGCTSGSTWTTPSSGKDNESTGNRMDGDCRRCGDPLNIMVQPMTGFLISWCCRCDETLLIERRRAPRD